MDLTGVYKNLCLFFWPDYSFPLTCLSPSGASLQMKYKLFLLLAMKAAHNWAAIHLPDLISQTSFS